MAGQLLGDGALDDAGRIGSAYYRVLGRPAQEKEIKAALEYVRLFPGKPDGQAGRSAGVDQLLPRFGFLERLPIYPLRNPMPDTSRFLSRRHLYAIPTAALA